MVIGPAVRKKGATNVGAQLAFTFLHSSEPKPREWYRLLLQWIFPLQLT